MKEVNLKDYIYKTSEEIDEKKIDKVLEGENIADERRKKLDASKLLGFFKQIKLGYEMLKDYRSRKYTEIPWKTIALITAALLYFLNPVDFIPDFMGFIGFTDDAIVLSLVFNAMRKDLIKYCSWKGYNPEEYFA
ncbi:MAG: YkvA family protein [Ignavibacteria bacterium]|jgi:uncharacterized membrane protein YkvA (DUF1232 family)|nr:YkvA family protein [Ignavibacteria bacterium]